jgi:hypothetical protein
MNQRIVYLPNEGGVAVIIPSPECLQKHTIEEIAAKDVPAGKPYKIVDVADIPSDRTFRNAWEVDEADLIDGVGGEHNMFITDPQHPDYVAVIKGEVTND